MSDRTTQTTLLTKEQIESIAPNECEYGEKIVGKATLRNLCIMALASLAADKVCEEYEIGDYRNSGRAIDEIRDILGRRK